MPLIMFKRRVLINPNTQFSLLHFLGVPFVCMQSFRLIGFMVLELWRRHTDTLTFISIARRLLLFMHLIVFINDFKPGVGLMVRVVGLGFLGPEFKSCLAVLSFFRSE